ncbi:amidohydrolase family protein [Pigmentiphaga sp. NML080357]|uniref:amidohydrolase family protein n=1 Tax=Pigmentiphaga sp. NML080357 TaxID=2008675 RepID=UPI001E2C0871|nr:amidohydrolase family protein [Pigmentiphaga sp. NML080357]
MDDLPILDAYTHLMPAAYLEQVARLSTNRDIAKRLGTVPMLYDVPLRIEMMKRFGNYQQVISLSQPSADNVVGPDESPALARLGNDGLAELVDRHPRYFPAFVASLPLNNIEAALEEFDRAVLKLGAAGIQIESNVQGVALDHPRFLPLFERAVFHDVPIWLHPHRGSRFADYPTEDKSRFEIWQVLGWPYETSAAMARLVFSGLLKRLPGLKIITHHLGGMIPYFEGRIGTLWDQIGVRTADEDLGYIKDMLGTRPVDCFRQFYGDTAVGGSASAIRCGLDFFGGDQVLFASDCPFDPEGGPGFIRDTLRAIRSLALPPDIHRKICYDNMAGLIGLAPQPDGERAAASTEEA